MNYSQYDEIADKYDELFVDEASLSENKEVGEMLLPLVGSVLDIGCGTGLLTEIVKVDASKYCGIDPSEKMLDVFYHKHPEFLHTIAAPYDGTIVNCDRFDNIVSLFGSASYLQSYALLRLGICQSRKFLMFYKEGYVPVTYKKCNVSFDHFDYSREYLKKIFMNDKIVEFNNYLIVSNGAS